MSISPKKKARKALRVIGLGAGCTVFLYCVAALGGALIPGATAHDGAGRDATVLLHAGPIHNDFLVPLDDRVRARFAGLGAAGVPVDASGAAWLVVGWGGAEFYTTVGTYRDVTAGAAWRGITGDASVMRIDVIGPVARDGGFRELHFGAAGFDAFLSAIDTSFARGADGVLRPLAPHPSGAWFFAAEGRFDILRTCNVWVGRMIRAGGLRFGIWTPTPYAVRLSHRVHAR